MNSAFNPRKFDLFWPMLPSANFIVLVFEPNIFNIGHPADAAEYVEVATIPSSSCGLTTVKFDMHEELLWTGNQQGYVASYYGSGLQKYTSFRKFSIILVREA